MSVKINQIKKYYNYHYMQFTVTPDEKKQINSFALKENYKTTSEFIRQIIFNYIRKRKNPRFLEEFEKKTEIISQIQLIANSVSQVLKNQETLLQREDVVENVKDLIVNLHRLVDLKSFSKEKETIIKLLKREKSLSLLKIQQEANLTEEIVLKIISDMDVFKITAKGGFALR